MFHCFWTRKNHWQLWKSWLLTNKQCIFHQEKGNRFCQHKLHLDNGDLIYLSYVQRLGLNQQKFGCKGVGVSLKSKHETSRWFVSKNWNFNIPCFWIFEHHFPNDLMAGILCLTAVSLFHDLCCTIFEIWVFESRGSFIFSRKIYVSFQTHIRFLPISPSKCLVKSCLMKATSEFSILTLQSPTEISRILWQNHPTSTGDFNQKKTSPSLRTPDGTRPGKRLHHELERSTMRKSWKIHYFDWAMASIANCKRLPEGNGTIWKPSNNNSNPEFTSTIQSSGSGNFPIDASKPLLRWFIHGRFCQKPWFIDVKWRLLSINHRFHFKHL